MDTVMAIHIMDGIILIMDTVGVILIMDMDTLTTDMVIHIMAMDITTTIIPIIQDEEALHTLVERTTILDIPKTLLQQEMQVALITEETLLTPIIAQLEIARPS